MLLNAPSAVSLLSISFALSACFRTPSSGDTEEGSTTETPSTTGGVSEPGEPSATSDTPDDTTTGADDDSSTGGDDPTTSDSSSGGGDDESSTGEPEDYPASCAALNDAEPGLPDGGYMIDVDGPGGLAPFEARCDMTTDGGGWTLIALNDQTTTFDVFDRTWDEYAEGFGDLVAQQRGWFGNHRLAVLTTGGLDLDVRHNHGVNVYTAFSVADEAGLFALSVTQTGASNDGGHLESGHSGQPFSTWDSDNDNHTANCAETFSAGWWYRDCFSVSIASGEDGGGVYWRPPPPQDGAPLWLDWVELWVR